MSHARPQMAPSAQKQRPSPILQEEPSFQEAKEATDQATTQSLERLYPAIPPTPPRSKWLKTWQTALISFVMLFLIGVVGSLAGCNPSSAPASPTATPKPTPTATTNPNASAPAYAAAVLEAANNVEATTTKFDTDCKDATEYTTICRNDLQAIHDAIASFQTTLDQHPAPPCLKVVDTIFREALRDYHDGLTLIIQGLDEKDAEAVSAGLQMLLDGSDEMSHAEVAAREVKC